MNPDFSSLLSDITAAPDRADELKLAFRKHTHYRIIRRRTAVALAVAVLCGGAFLQYGLTPEKAPSHAPIVAPNHTRSLTDDELLDSFGDQSVGLVTWPDGRKQLIAITPAPPGPARRR